MSPSALFAAAVLATLSLLCDAEFKMTFLHTNDVHAHYEQFNKYGNTCSDSQNKADQCFGGYARLAAAVKSRREKYPDSLLLDGGDQYQGTLWFYKYHGSVTSHFMNWVQYDVMALGNHEFDIGVEGLVPFLKAVNFSVISANINAAKEPAMKNLFSKSVERTVAGQRVGIVGYTTVDTPSISSSGRLEFKDVVTSVRQEVDRLRNAGVKVIIALGHAGFTVDKLVGNIPGVDVVVGGHTNTFLYTGEAPSDEVPQGVYPTVVTRGDGKALVVQCFTWAKYLCELHVTFDDEGQVVNYSGNPWLLNSTVLPDNATLQELQPWKAGIEDMANDVVGRSLVRLEGNYLVCRRQECNLGNLIADGMVHQNLRHPDDTHWNDVAIAILNGGAIRASLDRDEISVGDVMTVMPFANTIDSITIKGKYLRAALEHSVFKLVPGNTSDLAGAFLQVSGLRVKYDLRRSPGARVVRVQALCTACDVPLFKPLEDDGIYKVLLSSFIVRGGDGYTAISDNIIQHDLLGELDSDVFIKYLKSVSPVYPGLDGRIQFLEGGEECDTNAGSPSSSSLSVLLVCLAWIYVHCGQ